MIEDDVSEYNDIYITSYIPEIVAIHDPDSDTWIYNVNLYQNTDKTVYRIRSHINYEKREDAIMDANGVIELLGFNLTEKIAISCFKIVDDELTEEIILFDGHDFFPYDGDDDDVDE